jgi:poly(3-hydroxybutyrate) depolymerase
MTSRKSHFLWLALALLAGPAEAKVAPQKLQLVSGNRSRQYYLVVPEGVTVPAPLIILLHGSGRDGMSQIDAWQNLAEREGIILAAPNSSSSEQWSAPADGPEFLHDLAEAVKAKCSVDPRRIYLFGHSAGAVFALYMSLAESQYFAATAVHAGGMREDATRYMDNAARKIPIAIWMGTNDQFFPLEKVRASRDALKARGFPVQLTEIPGHDHNYYAISDQVNQEVWQFLRGISLPAEPKWQSYPNR